MLGDVCVATHTFCGRLVFVSIPTDADRPAHNRGTPCRKPPLRLGEPNRNPIHRLIQILNAQAIALSEFNLKMAELPYYVQPELFDACSWLKQVKQLFGDFAEVTKENQLSLASNRR